MARNPYREQVFRFKQFEVRNVASAMKVGTDGVLLGAWMPLSNGASVLDVGTGCGLIALMAAQRGAASVVGIEIEPDAAREASENVAASKWNNIVEIVNDDFFAVAEHFNHLGRRFDVIVSNPPFFTGGVYSPDASRLMARHGVSLDYPQLISVAATLLNPDGHLALVSPVDRRSDIELAVALSRLNIRCCCEVSTRVGAAPVRLLWNISAAVGPSSAVQRLTVGSPEYRTITDPFYLDKV